VKNTLIFTLFLIQTTPAMALFGSGGTNISQSAPCVGLDGIPITAGAMESMCCSGGRLNANAAPQCRAGFNTISGDAVGGAASNITLAQQTLGVVDNLNGVKSDINLVNTTRTGVNTVSPVKASTSGLIGGNGTGNDGTGLTGANLAGGSGKGHGGSGAGGGAGGGGSGGSGSGGFSGLDSGSGSGGANGKNGDGKDPNGDANKPLGGGFASAGGAGNGKDGGFGSAEINFGGGAGAGNGGADGSGNGMEELGFGDDALAEGEAGGDVEGTINDPANYFSLTNKGDDIFKIVSRRYTKKYKKFVLKDKARLPASKFQQNKPL
jgi:hypothetical protein